MCDWLTNNVIPHAHVARTVIPFTVPLSNGDKVALALAVKASFEKDLAVIIKNERTGFQQSTYGLHSNISRYGPTNTYFHVLAAPSSKNPKRNPEDGWAFEQKKRPVLAKEKMNRETLGIGLMETG